METQWMKLIRRIGKLKFKFKHRRQLLLNHQTYIRKHEVTSKLRRSFFQETWLTEEIKMEIYISVKTHTFHISPDYASIGCFVCASKQRTLLSCQQYRRYVSIFSQHALVTIHISQLTRYDMFRLAIGKITTTAKNVKDDCRVEVKEKN